jgi:hypothetical protein
LEAADLIEYQGAQSISNQREFQTAFSEFGQSDINEEKSSRCKNFVKERTGASEMIMKSISPYLKNL